MKKGAWKTKIKKACKEAGTYKPCFDMVIDALSDILVEREDAMKQFMESGGATIVSHTNKGGSTYMEKNPALVIVDDLNKTALTYWRDLGLTPKGLKAIDEKAMKKQKVTSLGDLLKGLES